MRTTSFVLLAALGSLSLGCSRVADVAYTLRTDAEKLDLPEKHEAQIAEYLAMSHGTPSNPRMALPDPDAEPAAAASDGVARRVSP